MDSAEKLDRLTLPLLRWYQENARSLPWRTSVTPYRVWVSEVMLQQTRVSAVIGYFERFMKELPDIAALAAVPEDVLLKLWQGLGYYSRARNLQKSAKEIMSTYGGAFPGSYDQIRALPGIGDYIAGAVSSIAFGIPAPAVDGNVMRVLARILGDMRDISQSDTRCAFRETVRAVIPHSAPGAYNQALMELGAMICLPNGMPRCEICPIREACVAQIENRTLQLPVKRPKKPRKVENRTIYLLFYNSRVALRRRPEHGLLGGLWEYPNELSDEKDWPKIWDLQILEQNFICKGKHVFTHIEWHMEAIAICVESDTLPEGWVWAGIPELEGIYALPSAFRFVRSTVSRYLLAEEAAL